MRGARAAMPVMRGVVAAATMAWALALLASPAAAQRIAPPPRAVADSAPATPRYPDAWLGEDKVQHFVASAAVTTLAYGAARIAMDDRAGARGVAIGAGAVAGLLKEVHDKRRGTIFSVRDLVWDAMGIGVGYLWIREIE